MIAIIWIILGIIFFTLLVFILAHVAQTAEPEGEGPNAYKAEFLFEKDGVRVYRFIDRGQRHYFTVPASTMTLNKISEILN